MGSYASSTETELLPSRRRLAVLVPRPRINLLLYYGVLGPRAAWRGIDVLACPRCGGRLRLIALIEQAAVIDRILRHLGVATEIPAPRPARAPPRAVGAPNQALVGTTPLRCSTPVPDALA
jgi:hypothetical protein